MLDVNAELIFTFYAEVSAQVSWIIRVEYLPVRQLLLNSMQYVVCQSMLGLGLGADAVLLVLIQVN